MVDSALQNLDKAKCEVSSENGVEYEYKLYNLRNLEDRGQNWPLGD